MPSMPLILMLLVALVVPLRGASAIEEAGYEVVDTLGEVEIRQYRRGVLAEVTLTANRDDAASQAFRVLFDYIGGANADARKISMTAPVVQRPAAQTSAAFDEAALAEPRQWRVAFFLPAEFDLDQSPVPADARVKLTPFAGGRLAALRFSGFWSDENFSMHAKALRERLDHAGLTPGAGPLFAYYDPPFMPWLFRRNEVMFEIHEPSAP